MRFAGLSILLVVLALAALVSASPGQAQEPDPTPTPTPTPNYLEAVPLSSGNTLIVEKRITYGDAAIVLALMVLIAVLIVSATYSAVRKEAA